MALPVIEFLYGFPVLDPQIAFSDALYDGVFQTPTPTTYDPIQLAKVDKGLDLGAQYSPVLLWRTRRSSLTLQPPSRGPAVRRRGFFLCG